MRLPARRFPPDKKCILPHKTLFQPPWVREMCVIYKYARSWVAEMCVIYEHLCALSWRIWRAKTMHFYEQKAWSAKNMHFYVILAIFDFILAPGYVFQRFFHAVLRCFMLLCIFWKKPGKQKTCIFTLF